VIIETWRGLSERLSVCCSGATVIASVMRYGSRASQGKVRPTASGSG